jgi:ABC-type transport system involved in multi-copper enzyme maturation permease subunit
VRLRLGPGPVFVYERLLARRRWQLYALRAGFLAVILAGMSLTWPNLLCHSRPVGAVSIQPMASFGESLFEMIISTELELVLSAAPAATAGAVCVDKGTGTLDHMLPTDLTSAEIVLGKLGVGMVPVLGLVAGVFPIMALVGLLGGIDPIALSGSFLVATGCAVLGSSLAFVFSLWGRKTNDVLMVTYLILILWVISPAMAYMAALSSGIPAPGLIGPTLWEWLKLSNPFYLVFAPYWDPGRVDLTTHSGFLATCPPGCSRLLRRCGFARQPRVRLDALLPRPGAGVAARPLARPHPVSRRRVLARVLRRTRTDSAWHFSPSRSIRAFWLNTGTSNRVR